MKRWQTRAKRQKSTTVIANQGQIYGNREKGSAAQVTNGKKFSYPGYNEFLTGAPDPRIDSNGKIPNPNTNVLEWINRQPSFKGRVAAFGTWDRLPYILNRERSGLYIVAGEEPIPGVSGETVADALVRHGHPSVVYEPRIREIPKLLRELFLPGDLVLTLGAGDVWKVGEALVRASPRRSKG